MENLTGYDDVFCEFALCAFNLIGQVVNFFWLLYEFNVVYVQLEKYSICCTVTTYELSRTKIKENHSDAFCLSFSHLYLFLRSCKFAIIETSAYDKAHDQNAMSSLIIQSV